MNVRITHISKNPTITCWSVHKKNQLLEASSVSSVLSTCISLVQHASTVLCYEWAVLQTHMHTDRQTKQESKPLWKEGKKMHTHTHALPKYTQEEQTYKNKHRRWRNKGTKQYHSLCSHVRAHTHACMHACTHTHTHIHTHTLLSPPEGLLNWCNLQYIMTESIRALWHFKSFVKEVLSKPSKWVSKKKKKKKRA